MAADLQDLVARSWALRSEVTRRITDAVASGGPEGRMRLFAEGMAAIHARLPVLEHATRSVIANLQQRTLFDPLRRERELNQRTRLRGIAGHLITSPSRHLSLVAACHPDTWIAPVHVVGLAVDDKLALFPGSPNVRGEPTAWLCDDRDLIDSLCDVWSRTKEIAVPIRDVPGVVRLTELQLTVISLLSAGHKDASVARSLGVSLRTVTGDVSRIMDALQVSTRWEAGLVLGGACFPVRSVRAGGGTADRFGANAPA